MLQCRCDVTDVINTDRQTAGFHYAATPRLKLPFRIIGPALAVIDAVVVVASGTLGGMAYQQAVGGGAPVGIYAGLGLVASLIYALAAFQLGLYRFGPLLQRQGRYAPPPGASDLPGLEVAGTVVRSGPNCRRSSMAAAKIRSRSVVMVPVS